MPPKKASERKFKKKPVPEDFELSDDEPTTIKLDEENRVSSEFITFDCPNCFTKLQLKNEIEINPKGIKCKCVPCSFKISKNDKKMSVNKSDDGDITLESELHSISFSWNKQITPESEDEKQRNKMISDVINTPRSNDKKQNSLNDLE